VGGRRQRRSWSCRRWRARCRTAGGTPRGPALARRATEALSTQRLPSRSSSLSGSRVAHQDQDENGHRASASSSRVLGPMTRTRGVRTVRLTTRREELP
jgi:hypothetical protein